MSADAERERETADGNESDDGYRASRSVGRFIRPYSAGDVVFEAGARGNAMYVVIAGRVRITRAGSGEVLNELGPGEFFGEMALVGDGVRRGTATALDDGTRLAEIDRARFVYLVGQQPAFSLTVMRVLSERLARAQGL